MKLYSINILPVLVKGQTPQTIALKVLALSPTLLSTQHQAEPSLLCNVDFMTASGDENKSRGELHLALRAVYFLCLCWAWPAVERQHGFGFLPTVFSAWSVPVISYYPVCSLQTGPVPSCICSVLFLPAQHTHLQLLPHLCETIASLCYLLLVCQAAGVMLNCE